MSRLFLLDASVLVPLLLDRGAEAVELLKGKACVLDLTIYESCNVTWKLAHLLRRIDAAEAARLAWSLKPLCEQGILSVVTYGELDLAEVMRAALKFGLTFYDAAYVTAAKRRTLTLSTEDGDLRALAEAASVAVADYEELLKELGG